MSPPAKPTDPPSERELAERIAAILARFEATPTLRRLRLRVRELGANQRDEVLQFQQFQKACRESPELTAALAGLGLGDLSKVNPRVPDAATGAAIQAFNRFVETRWTE